MIEGEDSIARNLQASDLARSQMNEAVSAFHVACQSLDWSSAESLQLAASVHLDQHCDAFRAACRGLELLNHGR